MNLPSAFLDANALYGIYIRDALLEFAAAKLFIPHWSAGVVAELTGALERNLRSSRKSLDALTAALESAFPFASVKAGEVRAKELEGVHAGDRHVLAAALTAHCDYLVTFNTKHFPQATMASQGIELITPDAFLVKLSTSNRGNALRVITQLIASYTNPQLDALTYSSALSKSQCTGFAAFIEAHAALIDTTRASSRPARG